MCWKSETTLRDIEMVAPDDCVEMWRDGVLVLATTPSALIEDGKLPGFLSVDQVEEAFSRGQTPACMRAPGFFIAMHRLAREEARQTRGAKVVRLPFGRLGNPAVAASAVAHVMGRK